MAHDLKDDLDPMLDGLRRMYRAANFATNATVMTVQQLRDVITQVQAGFNLAESSWTALVGHVGAAEALNTLSMRVAPPPADASAALVQIRTDALAMINAYNASTYANPGEAAWTYSASLVGGQIVGDHTDIEIDAPTLTTLNGLASTLRTSLLVLAPVE